LSKSEASETSRIIRQDRTSKIELPLQELYSKATDSINALSKTMVTFLLNVYQRFFSLLLFFIKMWSKHFFLNFSQRLLRPCLTQQQQKCDMFLLLLLY